MAEAGKLSSANSWPPEGYRIDVAFELIAKPLWDAYLAAPPPGLIALAPPGTMTEPEQRHARHNKAQAALDALLRKCVSPPGEFELWARPDRPMADLKPVPASQVG